MSDPSPNDPHWLEWYQKLLNDRVRRSMGLLGPEEGVMSCTDRLELMRKRHQLPENNDFDSVRRRMGLPPLKDKTVRKQIGLDEE